ncbi:hypothetical protein KUTeg_021103 [Tegillarca granosa]|uniref:Protein lifeguard 4 n=1 Tax=Tegillarca granosa TaxID=220873 RepID=A0ABQ9ECG5_TEGGR|nr:hypothetical protein KUTeg_021103 [Tegillarca granosa]
MATLLGESSKPQQKEPGIIDDFMYGSNVATAHVYIRLGFLRKVYGILTAQILLTVGVCALFMINESVQNYVQQSQWMLLVGFIGTMGVLIGLMVYRHETPTNYFLLGLFTIFESYSVGVLGNLFAALWILLLALFLQMLFPSELMDKAISVGGALLFSLFIIFDTHMLMHKLSPEEYIVAAINLYLDILNLFIYILRLVGDRKN